MVQSDRAQDGASDAISESPSICGVQVVSVLGFRLPFYKTPTLLLSLGLSVRVLWYLILSRPDVIHASSPGAPRMTYPVPTAECCAKSHRCCMLHWTHPACFSSTRAELLPQLSVLLFHLRTTSCRGVSQRAITHKGAALCCVCRLPDRRHCIRSTPAVVLRPPARDSTYGDDRLPFAMLMPALRAFAGPMVFASILYAKLLAIPLVVSYHTHIPEYIPRYTWKGLVGPMWGLIRFAARMADLTLVTSKVMKVWAAIMVSVAVPCLYGEKTRLMLLENRHLSARVSPNLA